MNKEREIIIDTILLRCNRNKERKFTNKLQYTKEELNELSLTELKQLFSKFLFNEDSKYKNYHLKIGGRQ